MATEMQQKSKSSARALAEPNAGFLESLVPYAGPWSRLFDDFWLRSPVASGDGLLSPAIDVAEDDQAVTVTAELPGLKKEDVRIEFENGVLSISGEKTQETEKTGRSYHRIERRYGAFHRSMTLPSRANVEKAEAEFADGVLKIRLPIREDAKPKVVKIK